MNNSETACFDYKLPPRLTFYRFVFFFFCIFAPHQFKVEFQIRIRAVTPPFSQRWMRQAPAPTAAVNDKGDA